MSQKYNLFLDIDDTNAGDVTASTEADGSIVWKVDPCQTNELILALKNGDDPAKQKKDVNGRDVGIVLRSVEFLKHDLDFELSGTVIVQMFRLILDQFISR